MTTGQKIQQRRKQFGWSQDQLAAQLNVSRQSISKWEMDVALPDLQNGVELSKVLGISIEELLHKEESVVMETIVANENAFQSAEKFLKKTWHYSGLYIALSGLAMTLGAYLFRIITAAMNQQADSIFDGMNGGLFGDRPEITSVFDPFLNGIMLIGMMIMIVGTSIFLYGQFKKQQAY